MKKIFAFVAVAGLSLWLAPVAPAQCKDGSCSSTGKGTAVLEKVRSDKAEASSTKTGKAVITTGSLVALMESKTPFTLVDARGESKSHIPGSVAATKATLNCPVTMARTVGDKDRLVVTYCSGPQCSASTQVAARLRDAGYTNVVEYRQGWAGWNSYQKKCVAAREAQCGKGACGNKGACGGCQIKSVPATHANAQVTTPALMAMVRAKVPHFLIDARSSRGADDQGIPGSVYMPPASFPKKMAKLPKDKNTLIVAYCTNTRCPSSTKVATKLRAAGYSNVIVYPEGIEGWRSASAKKASCCTDDGSCKGANGSCTGSSKGSCSDKPSKKKSSCCGGCGGSDS